MSSSDKGLRRGAAEALVAIYQAGGLDDELRGLVLARRDTIASHHEDRVDMTHHTDYDMDHGEWHQDSGAEHVDRGIGVPFPLESGEVGKGRE